MPSSRDTTEQISSFTYRKETLSAADYHALARSLRQELDVPVTSLTCSSKSNTRTHKRSCIDIHLHARTCISFGTRTHASTYTRTPFFYPSFPHTGRVDACSWISTIALRSRSRPPLPGLYSCSSSDHNSVSCYGLVQSVPIDEFSLIS